MIIEAAQPSRSAYDYAQAQSAFEAIFIAHYQRVFALLTRLVGDRTLADELASETFCRLYRQPARAAAWNNTVGWLCRTATNLGIDALRAAARRRQYEYAAGVHAQGTTAAGAGPLDCVLRAEECRQVRAVLSTMKPAQAQILLMRAAGSSYKELAQALDVAIGAVGTLLNRAEAEFRKRYIKMTKQKEGL